MQVSIGVYSRPDKGNHAETVLYEIDMLRFAAERLFSPNSVWLEADQWVYLEDFLLHYRNLIEFFGKPKPRGTDLTIRRPQDFWESRLPKDLGSMWRQDLWNKYEGGPKNPEAISKYLHHCTKHRVIKKKWNVKEMFDELRPITEKFESLFPHYRITPGLQTRGVNASTGNATNTTRILEVGLNEI
jgi:hypothetical protein